MIQKRRLYTNAIVSVVQVVVNGIVFFLLRRYLYETIGPEDVGVWSVVLAWSSVSSLANMGMAGSAVKYISMYLARGDTRQVTRVIETAVLSVAVAVGGLLILLYPVFRMALPHFIEPAEKIPAALSILPFAILSFWITALSGVIQSCLDGFQRIDLRNILVMVSGVAYLLLSILLVPSNGLIGLAWAQLVQAVLLTVSCWVIIRHLISGLSLVPFRWHRDVFNEMLVYNLNFQATSILQMLFEPATKAIISKFGGVSAAGYFDTANKLALQLRGLVVAAHSSIIPAISDLHERQPELVKTLYRDSFRLILFFVIPALPVLLACTPAFSLLLIGSFQVEFVLYAVILLCAWFLNMFSGPAYFANMGVGRLKWNVWDHAATSAITVILGVFLGITSEGPGVVSAYAVGILCGSTLVIVMYHREHHIRWPEVVGCEYRTSIIAGSVGLCFMVVLYRFLDSSISIYPLTFLLIGVYSGAVFYPLWQHPVRKSLFASIQSSFASSALSTHSSSD